MANCDFTKNDTPKLFSAQKNAPQNMAHPVPAYMPGCIPCKTYAEVTPIPKLSYARYFQGKRTAKNLSTDDFKKLRVLAQILSVSQKKCTC